MDQIAATYLAKGAAVGIEVLTSFEGMTLPIGDGVAPSESREAAVKIRFWGVRGSFAMCGRDFLRYGGNTTLVELVTNAGQRLLIDLGTGATELAKHLMGGEFGKGQGKLPILLTHTHLDHIQGLPFFTPFFIKGNEIRIMGADPISGALARGDAAEPARAALQPAQRPREPRRRRVDRERSCPARTIAVPGFEVATAAVPHGSMWTTAFRITADGKIVTFLSDVEYPQPRRAAAAGARARAGRRPADPRRDARRSRLRACAAAGATRRRAPVWSSPSARARRSSRCSITAPTRPTT